jgi:hypothetical protein
MDNTAANIIARIENIQKLANDHMTDNDRQLITDTCEEIWSARELWLIAKDILTPEQIAAFSITVYASDIENAERAQEMVDRLSEGISDVLIEVPNADKILLFALEADLSAELLWKLSSVVLEPTQLLEVMRKAVELDFGTDFEVDFDI